ncbi:MAG TPA: hypothetical protein VHD90_02350 [Phototrophicaceae bacterium]|nr:hypothetical protein [Phototrophicaceae bacterium]
MYPRRGGWGRGGWGGRGWGGRGWGGGWGRGYGGWGRGYYGGGWGGWGMPGCWYILLLAGLFIFGGALAIGSAIHLI